MQDIKPKDITSVEKKKKRYEVKKKIRVKGIDKQNREISKHWWMRGCKARGGRWDEGAKEGNASGGGSGE